MRFVVCHRHDMGGAAACALAISRLHTYEVLMDLQLTDKKAIVTGSSRGIVRAITRQLALEGCDVAICARTEGLQAPLQRDEHRGRRGNGDGAHICDGPGICE